MCGFPGVYTLPLEEAGVVRRRVEVHRSAPGDKVSPATMVTGADSGDPSSRTTWCGPVRKAASMAAS